MHSALHPSAGSVAYVGTAAAAPVDQAVLLQQCDCLTYGLAGHIKTETQLLFCHQSLSVTKNAFRNLPAQHVRDLQIFGLIRHYKHILSHYVVPIIPDKFVKFNTSS